MLSSPNLLMLGSALSLSLMPLAIDLSIGDSNPAWFSLFSVLGLVLGLGLYLPIAYRSQLGLVRKGLVRAWSGPRRRRLLIFMLLLGAVVNFDYLVFAWASQRVDTAVVAVLFETWPIFYIASVSFCDRFGLASGNLRAARRYRPLTARQLVMIPVTTMGVGLVIYSATGGSLVVGGGLTVALIGCLAAVGAAFLTSLAWAETIWAAAVAVKAGPPGSKEAVVAGGACVMVASLLTALIYLPVGLALGLAGGGWTAGSELVIGFGAGFVLLSASVICFRESNLRAKDLSVNALSAFGPVMALLWLFLFTDVSIGYPVLFVLGALVVVGSGVAIQRPK